MTEYIRLHPDDIELLAQKIAEAMKPKRAAPKGPTETEITEATRWFDEWANTLGYAGRVKPGGFRQQIAILRIREGRTFEEWAQIVRWVKTDPHMRGQNDSNRAYDDFDTLAATSKKFEKYLKVSQRGLGRATNTSPNLFKGESGVGRRL